MVSVVAAMVARNREGSRPNDGLKMVGCSRGLRNILKGLFIRTKGRGYRKVRADCVLLNYLPPCHGQSLGLGNMRGHKYIGVGIGRGAWATELPRQNVDVKHIITRETSDLTLFVDVDLSFRVIQTPELDKPG